MFYFAARLLALHSKHIMRIVKIDGSNDAWLERPINCYQNRIIAENIDNIKRILTKSGRMLKITKIYKRSNLFLANKKKRIINLKNISRP